VLNLFKFFQLEKSGEDHFIPPDNLIKRTCKAAGISYSSVYRVVNGKSPPESNRRKERKKTLDDFDRCVIKRTVHSMYNRKIAPTVSKIKKEIEDTIKISKSTLTLTLLDLGYEYKKSVDNRRLLYVQRSVITSEKSGSFERMGMKFWMRPGLIRIMLLTTCVYQLMVLMPQRSLQEKVKG
jgi:hypothetical protein